VDADCPQIRWKKIEVVRKLEQPPSSTALFLICGREHQRAEESGIGTAQERDNSEDRDQEQATESWLVMVQREMEKPGSGDKVENA
jgi:hypothetical protein